VLWLRKHCHLRPVSFDFRKIKACPHASRSSKISGINGDSKDPKHRGWIEPLSWGLDQRGTAGVGSAGPRDGVHVVKELRFTMRAGAVSESLFRAIANGTAFEEMILEIVEGDRLVARFRFRNVYVSTAAYHAGDGSGEDDRLAAFSLEYESAATTFGEKTPAKARNSWDCWPDSAGFQVCLPERRTG
jgi:type VI protein secretion system component Hcp